jgi:DGQHR domain-containing protein
MMEIDAFRVTQRGGAEGFEIYVSSLRAVDLVNRCIFDRWSPENPLGYQRLPVANRLGDKRGGALRYLLREMGCFPTSILLNVRGEIGFKPEGETNWFAKGRLDLGDERLWVIDGQHRVEALRLAMERNADFEDYPVIVSILRKPERFDELMLFYVVNRRQKGISTDLANRHLQRMLWEKGSGWLYDFEGPRAVRLGLGSEVVDELNSNPESPWRGRIRRVGEDELPGQVTTDRVFASAVAEVLREKAFIGVPVRDFAAGLASYWGELSRIYPEAFDEPTGYVLLSPTGIRAFTLLFARVYQLAKESGPVTGESLAAILGGLLKKTQGHGNPVFRQPLNVGVWSREIGSKTLDLGSSELFRCLAEKLQPALA